MNTFLKGTAIAVFLLVGITSAQTTTETTPPTAGFADVDGDGIADGTAAQHREKTAVKQKVQARKQLKDGKTSRPENAGVKVRDRKQVVQGLANKSMQPGGVAQHVREQAKKKHHELNVNPIPEGDATREQVMDQRRLNEMQKQQLRQLIHTMKSEGKTTTEIKAAAGQTLADWGIRGPGGQTTDTSGAE